MGDEDLKALRQLKEKLVVEASDLIKKLKHQEKHGCQQSLHITSLPAEVKTPPNTMEEVSSRKQETKLCEMSHEITGVRFKDIDKNWLHDNVYRYTCTLQSKAISFYMDLTVDVKNEAEYEVLDINCHFVNIERCILLEVTPWVQKITRMKNFSLLISAISQYSDSSVYRSKVTRKMEKQKFVILEACEDENGGILVRVCSPGNGENVYLEFQWSILFFERTCHMEHYLTINSTDYGVTFAEEHQELLKEFCKLSITNNELTELWQKLIDAVVEYENKEE